MRKSALASPRVVVGLVAFVVGASSCGQPIDPTDEAVDTAETALEACPPSVSRVGDFNGDGHADILFHRHDGTGAMWFMNGSTVLSGDLLPALDATWSVAGVADFNGDGKADIVFQKAGWAKLWTMSGPSVLSSSDIQLPAGWAIQGVGDFDGDHYADLFLHRADGSSAIWFMNGATVVAGNLLPALDPSWKIVGASDLNRDGKSDVVFNDGAGTSRVWLLNGASVAASADLPQIPPEWVVAAVADFNGDGRGDLIYHLPDGSTAVWLMNGTTIVAGNNLPPLDPLWSIAGAGDFTSAHPGAELLLEQADGSGAVWKTTAAVVPSDYLPQVDPAWYACVPSECSNGILDDPETDVDCGGGSCALCSDGLACTQNSDCDSGTCASGVCVSGSAGCTNGIMDGAETDVDCGGGTCSPCAVGEHCAHDVDCETSACDGGICVGPPEIGSCDGGWCWVAPRPTGEQYVSVAANSLDDAWLSTGTGSVYHWDGSALEHRQPAGGGGALFIDTPGSVWLVNATGHALHWDGASWNDTGIAAPSAPREIIGTFASGLPFNCQRWFDGSTWVALPQIPNTGCRSAWGASGTSFFEMDYTGAVYQYASGSFTQVVAASPWDVKYARQLPGGDVIGLANQQYRALKLIGSQWVDIGGVTSSSSFIRGLSGSDFYVYPDRLHYSGGTFVDTPGSAQIAAVLPNNHTLEATGSHLWTFDGSAQVELSQGPFFFTLSSPRYANQTPIIAFSDHDIWSPPYHWDGLGWTQLTFAPYTGHAIDVSAVWGSGPADVWFAGSYAHGDVFDGLSYHVVYHYDGTSLGPPQLLGTVNANDPMFGIWGSGPSDIYAWADPGPVYHYDGATWTKLQSSRTDFTGTAPNDIWAIEGLNYAVSHWDGASWTSHSVPATNYLKQIVVAAPADIWVTSKAGEVFRSVGGSAFTAVPGVSGARFILSSQGRRYVWTDAPSGVPPYPLLSFTNTPADGTSVAVGFQPMGSWEDSAGNVYLRASSGVLMKAP